jgi:hypothetical protein
MAGTTGLEPATSAVTGQRSNQLNYVPTSIFTVQQALLDTAFGVSRRLPGLQWFREEPPAKTSLRSVCHEG